MTIALPDNPTPEQLQQIVLTLIRFDLEPDADQIGEIEPIAAGYKTTYVAGGIKYELESSAEGWSKIPVSVASDFVEVDPRMTMLAFWLPADVAKAIAISPDDLPEAEPPDQLHLTLAYFGKPAAVPLPEWTKAIQKLCDRTPPITAKLGAWGRFPASESSDGKDVIWAGVDAPGLIELRQELIGLSAKLEMTAYANHGYTPHITLAYIQPGKEFTPKIEQVDVTLDRVVLTVGTTQHSFLLQGTVDNSESHDFRAVIDRVLKWQGLDIGIEYLPGQTRFKGTGHERKLRSAYGHIRGYVGADKEALDVYIHPDCLENGGSDRLFQVDQLSPEDGDFDEHKFMAGWENEAQAKTAYLREMPEPFFGGIKEVSVDDLEEYRRKREFEEVLGAIVSGTYDFAAKSKSAGGAPKQKKCTPGKSHFCQKPGGAGTCIPISKNCGYQPTGNVQQTATYLGASPAPTTTTATTTTAKKRTTKNQTAATQPPTSASNISSIKTNQPELDKSRADLEKRVGTPTVEAAEKNVQRIMNDPDTSVFVRVGSASTLEQILGDRFKTSAELGVDTHSIPHLRDGYQKARNRVESKTLGYDEKTTDPADRPIYGYIGGKDLNGDSHADVSQAYGSIAVKLKSEVKDRTTFTAADSFKSGIASPIKNDGTPPPPNAASLVASTRHGYDVDKLPSSYPSSYNDKSIHGSQLRQAAKAKSVDDLVGVGATTGNRYIEAQVHGKVKPSDIGEIHFSPKGQSDRPNAAIAKFAKDNKVELYVNGKKLSDNDLDGIINPPKDKRSGRLQDLAKALDNDDFDTVSKRALEIHDNAGKLTLNSGERDRYLKALYQESGYDGLPKVAKSDDIDKIWNDGGVLMVRGVSADPLDRLKYLKDFQSGDYFTGNGVYGNGTYVGHSGTIKGGRFVARDPKTFAKDAKDAVDDVAKHNYIDSKTVNFRMALDSDASVVVQSDLLKERNALETKVDNWATGKRQSLMAGAKVATKTDVTSYNRSLKKAQNSYDVAQTQVSTVSTRKVNGGSTTVETQKWNVPSKTGKGDFEIEVTKRSSSGGGTYFTVTDKYGNVITSITQSRGGKPNATTQKDIFNAVTAHQTYTKAGFDKPPRVGDINDPVVAKKVKDFDDDLAKTKTVLGLDYNGYSNLAVVKGYDAVALDQSYESKTFMNLLNRSKTVIQDTPLDWKRAKKTGAA